jgi:hypothetical protein
MAGHLVPLSGPSIKIQRADKHLHELADAINRFRESGAYQLAIEPDHEARKHILRAKIERAPPVVEWGIVIGDIVHNLRSALDHMMWSLTARYCGPPPEIIGGAWRYVDFPIQCRSWNEAAAFPIKGMPAELIAYVKHLQPCNRSQDDPLRDPLAVLNELWIGDKHRTITLVQYYAHTKLEPFGMVLRTSSQRADGPVEDGAEIARVPFGSLPPKMDVYARSTFDVAFEEGPPAYGGRVVHTLDRIEREVLSILWTLEAM